MLPVRSRYAAESTSGARPLDREDARREEDMGAVLVLACAMPWRVRGVERVGYEHCCDVAGGIPMDVEFVGVMWAIICTNASGGTRIGGGSES